MNEYIFIDTSRICLEIFQIRSYWMTCQILSEYCLAEFTSRVNERGGDFYTVLLDCDRTERSWESNAEKVTSDVRSRNSSHGFYFQHFQASPRERTKIDVLSVSTGTHCI